VAISAWKLDLEFYIYRHEHSSLLASSNIPATTATTRAT